MSTSTRTPTGYGKASISTSNTSYYFSAMSTSPPAGTAQRGTTQTIDPGSTPGGYLLSDYAVWTGQTGSTLTAKIAAAEVSGHGNPGISGIEIVNEAPYQCQPGQRERQFGD